MSTPHCCNYMCVYVGDIRGAHPTSYHSFVKVLCNYITERHQETQGEDLPYSTVYVRQQGV